jgi:hypothetical protein
MPERFHQKCFVMQTYRMNPLLKEMGGKALKILPSLHQPSRNIDTLKYGAL